MLLDTSGLLCYVHRDEPQHEKTVQLVDSAGSRLLTHGYVQDETYSLCDAVSFVLMRQRGISDALTTDRHFEQEGFIRLLPPVS